MSTIAEKLVLLHRTKTDIKAAIETKGQTVGGMAFSQYANRVRAIKGLSPVTPPSASTTAVAGKLNHLNDTKADIKTAIEACGVPVGSIPFSQYADKIRAIQIEPTIVETYLEYIDGYEISFDMIEVSTNKRTFQLRDEPYGRIRLQNGEYVESIYIEASNSNNTDTVYAETTYNGEVFDAFHLDAAETTVFSTSGMSASETKEGTTNIISVKESIM